MVLPKCLWVQKETIVFDGNTLDIPFLNKDQYIIGTFSANFCNQFILLKKMIPGSTIKLAFNNMNVITNPLGKVGGSYLTFDPETYWGKAGTRWLGGKGKYNPINSIIHHFLNVVKENIHDYNPDTHSDKIGVVLTTRDYVQVSHLEKDRLNEKDNLSWIYHSPLCHEGS